MPEKSIYEKNQHIADILLGEAVGEGPEGMEFVRDVMWNRAKRLGKSLFDVATAPKQFSAANRKDLFQFVRQQPMALRFYAQKLVEQAQEPDFMPLHKGIEHYVTEDLWQKRNALPATHWLRQMEPVKIIGTHVALRPRRR